MKKNNKLNTFKNLALISQLGISAVTPMILGVLLGMYIDEKFGTKGVFSIILLILGAGAGMLNMFKMAMPKEKKSNKDENEDDKDE